MDLALAADEDEHVAGPGSDELVDCVANGLDLVAVVVLFDPERPMANLDGKGPPRDLDHGHHGAIAGEVTREPLGVDGGGRDDDP